MLFRSREPRPLKRLYDRRAEMMDLLRSEYKQSGSMWEGDLPKKLAIERFSKLDVAVNHFGVACENRLERMAPGLHIFRRLYRSVRVRTLDWPAPRLFAWTKDETG